MKKIGILGGLGPESTVDYYKEIIGAFNSKYTHLAYPDILVYSANINELMTFVGDENWQGLSKWLLEKIDSFYFSKVCFSMSSHYKHVLG